MGAGLICHSCVTPISHSEQLELGGLCRTCFNKELTSSLHDTPTLIFDYTEAEVDEAVVTLLEPAPVENTDDLTEKDLTVTTSDEAITILDFLWSEEEAERLLRDDLYDILLTNCIRMGETLKSGVSTRLRFCIRDIFQNRNMNCKKHCFQVRPYLITFANEYVKYRALVEKGLDDPVAFAAEVCEPQCQWGWRGECFVSSELAHIQWCMSNYYKYGEMVITDVYEHLDSKDLRDRDDTLLEFYCTGVLNSQKHRVKPDARTTTTHTGRYKAWTPKKKVMFFSRSNPTPVLTTA